MLVTGFHKADIALEIDRAVVVAFVEVDCDADRRARSDESAVLEGFGLAENPWLLCLVIWVEEQAGGLGHCFEHHYAGQDWEVRKVVLQVFLCGTHMLDRYERGVGAIEDPVNE